jgi:sec-independent protein translocase protein TatA
MFGFHIWELLIILLIVILLFGARRLPQLGSSLGQTVKMFQKGAKGDDEPDELEAPAKTVESAKESER